jgi:hypothetical protein
MALYRALRETWLSDQCRKVYPGDEFEANYSNNFKLGDNLELVIADSPDEPPADEPPSDVNQRNTKK